MRIVFMGTPEFAVVSLQKLLQRGYDVVAVVTAPDRPAGRGQQIRKSSVKEFAQTKNLKILQPEKLKDPEFISELRALNADIQIVVAFRMLPEAVWNMPALGTYNLHASLLPKYRGAAPINWAIINGEKETGVTTFRLQHEVDTGGICMQQRVTISDTMTAGELHDILKHTGADVLLKTVAAIEVASAQNKEVHVIPQDDRMSSHAPKIFKETCRINWGKNIIGIYNLVRGLSPYPGAFTSLHNAVTKETLQIKIFRAGMHQLMHKENPGRIETDNTNFIKVYCQGGLLELQEIQVEGKRRMPVKDFLRGHKITGDAWLV